MTPADKLIHSITQSLNGGAVRTDANTLATDYAKWCATANRRLEQCVTLLERGAESEALQLAETTPSLLDLCAALSFHQADQWREVCKQKNLALPEDLNERAISRLNDLYAKGISAGHPLYREYRRAIAERDEARALTVLRSIVRLNPADASARQEISRLEENVRAAKLAQLKQTVEENDVSATLELLAQLEGLGANLAAGDRVVQQALALRQERLRDEAFERCRGLVEWLTRLKDREAWQEALGPVQEVEQLSAQHGITLDSQSAPAFAEVKAWAEGLERQRQTEEQFQAALRDIAFRVEQAETKDVPGTGRGLKSLREEQHQLIKQWREVETFGKPVPEELHTRVKRRLGTVQTEVNRLTRQRRLVTTISVVAVVVCLAVLAGWLFRLRWSAARVVELAGLQEKRQVSVAEKFIGTLRQTKPGAVTQPNLAVAIQQAEHWIGAERAQVAFARAALVNLQRHATGQFAGAPLHEAAKATEQVRQLVAGLAPEFRAEFTAPLLEFENQLDAFAVTEQRKLREEFTGLLHEAEPHLAALEERAATLDSIRVAADALAQIVSQLEARASPPTAKLRLPESLTSRIPAMKTRLTPYQESLDKLAAAEIELRRARSWPEYWAALERYDADYLRQLPQVRAAGLVLRSRALVDEIDRLLLLPTDALGWQYFKKNPSLSKTPSEVMPAERSKWLSLRDDDNLREIHRYLLPTGAAGSPNCTPKIPTSHIFTRGPWNVIRVRPGTAGGHYMDFVAEIYAPEEDSSRAGFKRDTFECACPPDQLNRRADSGGLTRESALLPQIGLNQFINGAGDAFERSLLAIVDRLRGAEGVSPLFRAYVHFQLLEILAIRPQAWGAQWIPALASDTATLKELGADRLRSGDWMVPTMIGRYEKKLAEFYAQTRQVSYARQAKFFEKLTRDAVTAGFHYAGYVGADGTPVLTTDGTRAQNLWGLTAPDPKPAWLWRGVVGQQTLQPVAPSQPFTPLFYCGRDVRELLDAAAKESKVDPESPSIKPFLPPLFQSEVAP